MGSALSVIVVACGPDRLLRRAAEALAEQTLEDLEVVVAHDRGDEGSARRRLEANGVSRPCTLVATSGCRPGALRNTAVRASRGRYCVILDGSEALDGRYLEAALLALEDAPDVAFATTRPANAPAADEPTPEAASRVAPGDLLASPWSAAAATVMRRAAWDAAGGYDEALPALADWELLLRLARDGRAGIWLAPGLASRFHRDDVLLRQALAPDRYLPSIRRVIQKHAAAFEAEAPRALCARERIGQALWQREHDLIERRDAARAQLEALTAELLQLRSELWKRGRDSTAWDDLRRTAPVSRTWGLERGRPIDRFYIEGFIEAHADDIKGAVLELLDDGLTRRFGGDRVERSDVLDIDPDNRRATIVADLRDARQIDSETYDCFILTQTLHVIDDIDAAIAEAHRVLKPGGVLLATLPALSMIAPDGGPDSDYWRVTAAGARVLFEKRFPQASVEVRARGNVLAATAFLHGLSCDEVTAAELDENDPDYPVVVTVRAVKEGRAGARAAGRAEAPAAILLYHRVAEPAHDIHHLAVSPSTFRSQMQALARHWNVVPLAVLADACVSGAPPARSIALTFDDGYLDNLENVVPVLEELRLPATFFLTAERADDELGFWWDVLEQVVLLQPELPPELVLRLDGRAQAFPTLDAEARQATHDRLYKLIKASGPAVRDDLLRQLAMSEGGPGLQAYRMAGPPSPAARRMTAAEVRRLAAVPGVEIGAHGLHHLALPSLSRDDLHREVFEGRSALERLVGRPVTAFAYPYGEVSAACVDAVVAADFRCGVTCEPRGLRDRDRPLLLPRLDPGARAAGDLLSWLEEATAARR